MKASCFKTHTITRSCPPRKNDYRDYRSLLRQDFCGRCAYCNSSDSDIAVIPFEIDHFIPKKVCISSDREDLLTDYRNLVYSCKKCNNAKGAQHSGELVAEFPTNQLFYDPVETDYNTVFYRNELGAICSITDKGKRQIERLRLFRLFYALAWICEQTNELAEKLKAAIAAEQDEAIRERLTEAYNKMNEQYRLFNREFIAAYHDGD